MSKWVEYFMDVSFRTAELSYCKRLKVGAVAVRDRRIIACGFNGMPAGQDNCCEEVIDNQTVTRPEVSHAEENLITFAARNGISLDGCQLYITHAPCIHCAKLIRNSGFDSVFYRNIYRSEDGLIYLTKNGIETINV
jgi:dCMP deaminase